MRFRNSICFIYTTFPFFSFFSLHQLRVLFVFYSSFIYSFIGFFFFFSLNPRPHDHQQKKKLAVMIPITQNLLQTLENQNTQNFSTDLTLSCVLHTELNTNKCNEEEEAMISDDDGTQNLLQTLENQNTQTLSCEFRNKTRTKRGFNGTDAV